MNTNASRVEKELIPNGRRMISQQQILIENGYNSNKFNDWTVFKKQSLLLSEGFWKKYGKKIKIKKECVQTKGY